MIKITN